MPLLMPLLLAGVLGLAATDGRAAGRPNVLVLLVRAAVWGAAGRRVLLPGRPAPGSG